MDADGLDFWTINNGYVLRHHKTLRTKLFTVTEEGPEKCPIPMKWMDVLRHTTTTLPDRKTRFTGEYWVAEGDRDLEESWAGHTRFSIISLLPKFGFTYVD